MRILLSAALFFSLIGAAAAGGSLFRNVNGRSADAASDACAANCVNENASCRRVCPTTLGASCLSACDSQAQTCRQSCQRRS